MLAGACTVPNGPPKHDWKVKPVSVKVVNKEDPDAGDEPYVIQVGFRSKIGVPDSSWAGISSQCYSRKLPANNVGKPGTVVPIPPGSADIAFPNAQNLDIGDVLLKTAPLEIFGTISFVMERDGLFPTSCAMSDAFRSILVPALSRALNLLLGNVNTPPTQDQLIKLIVGLLGNVLSGIGSLIVSVLEGLGNPDDVLGTVIQIHLPTKGAFTDLMKFGLAVAGLDNGELPIEGLPDSVKFRIGQLLPSKATFNLSGPGYNHIYTSSVGT